MNDPHGLMHRLNASKLDLLLHPSNPGIVRKRAGLTKLCLTRLSNHPDPQRAYRSMHAYIRHSIAKGATHQTHGYPLFEDIINQIYVDFPPV